MANNLDSRDFDASEYQDKLFPSETSLDTNTLSATLDNLRHQHHSVTQSIRQHLRSQSNNTPKTPSLAATQQSILQLHRQITEMRSRARHSEHTVLDITQDIKALDAAKRNLTQTTKAMRQLQMLSDSVDQLAALKEREKYGEATQLLGAVGGLGEALVGFEKVGRVKELLDRAEALRDSLASRAVQRVEAGFDGQGQLAGSLELMRDACRCAEAASGEGTKIIEFYCDLQLKAYSAIFQLSDDVSQVENISRRFAWIRRILRNYTEDHAGVFPDDWRVGERLCWRFAELTRDQLAEIMATHGLAAGRLMEAVTDTRAFEAQCDKRFEVNEATFVGSISCAFEPYMSVFVQGEQTKFEAMIAKFQKTRTDDMTSGVLASSTDLLYQFRESLRQCALLSTGQAMVDLAAVFGRCLDSYARDVLVFRLPRAKGLEDLKLTCLIINTADYCASVAGQLEQKIKEKIDPEHKVSFAHSRETLLGTINTSIRKLVSGVESMCGEALDALAGGPWHDLQMVGDQSPYVLLITSALEASIQTIGKHLSGSRYFRSYCDKFATRLGDRYMAALGKCGTISEVGAEQLLLDAQALKAALLGMPGMGKEGNVSNTYKAIVSQGVGKIEALLKAVMAPSEPPEGLVDRFGVVFPQMPVEKFQKVLNLKGIPAVEQSQYIRIFRKEVPVGDRKSKTVSPTKPTGIVYPDPLGITGAKDDSEEVLAVNATATRPKINENLRKLMTNIYQ